MESIDLEVCRATLFQADPSRVAVILPGKVYPITAPVLWFASEALHAAGWTVLGIDDAYSDGDMLAWVEARARAALEWAGAARVMVVAKSMSTRAAALAAERSLPGVWLTPLLNDASVFEALKAIDARGLAVGSPSDPTWSQALSVHLRRMEILQLPGVNHALEVPGDPQRSIELLGRITDRISRFAGSFR
jgi:hypothetical protein